MCEGHRGPTPQAFKRVGNRGLLMIEGDPAPDAGEQGPESGSARVRRFPELSRLPVAVHRWALDRWRGTRQALRDRYVLALTIGVLLYGVVWTYISLVRFYTGNAAVYDLGLTMLRPWAFAHPPDVPVLVYLSALLDEPFEAAFIPVGLLGSFPLLFALQSFALGAAALPLFGIARRTLNSSPAALMVSASYLLYFPLGGLNWFDVHYIAFFIPLFLTGYYLYLRRSFLWAGVFLGIAGTTEYPVILLVVIFAITLLLEWAYWRWIGKSPRRAPPLRFALVLFGASVLFFAYQYVYLTAALGPTSFSTTVHIGGGSTIPFSSRATALELLLLPALFLSILSPRWILLFGPSAYLILFSGYPPLTYPSLFHTQYSALFIPFVFLGLLDVLHHVHRLWKARDVGPRPTSHRWKSRLARVPLVTLVATAVLVTTSVTAVYFQPYGPLNGQTDNPFDLGSITPEDARHFQEQMQLESLIPRSTPYVVFQNDMPTMLPRPLDYLETPEVAGIGSWQNVTLYDAQVGAYPYLTFNGSTIAMRVDYMIDDPYTPAFYELGTATNNSIYHFVQTGYGSGKYGILGEIDGMLALERGYTGAPEAYTPFQTTIPAGQMLNTVPTDQLAGGLLTFSNGSAATIWDGPFSADSRVVLSPGWYQVTYELRSSSTLPSNHVNLSVYADYGRERLAMQPLTGRNFTTPGAWTAVTFRMYVPDLYQYVGFPATEASWQGSLTLRTIEVEQLSAGTPTYS